MKPHLKNVCNAYTEVSIFELIVNYMRQIRAQFEFQYQNIQGAVLSSNIKSRINGLELICTSTDFENLM